MDIQKKIKQFLLSFKSIFLGALLIIVLAFQNCGQELQSSASLGSESEADVNCIDVNGDVIVGCVPVAPEGEIRTCPMANGIGAQVFKDSQWGPCIAQSCDAGYDIVAGACKFVEVSQACTVANGTGVKTNTGSGFGPCVVRSCSAGYHMVGTTSCAFTPVTRACTVANGTGTQTNTGAGFGACDVQTCNTGYRENGTQCTFIPVTRTCTVNNGTGTQTNMGSGFGPCVPMTCSAGYHIENNKCVFTPVTRSCTIANGTGTQTNTGSGFGTCMVTSCSSGYHKEGNACKFTAVTRSCSVSNGTGSQTNTGSGFGACQVVSCNSGYVEYENRCQVKTKTCTVSNGTGEQTFNNGAWGSCVAKSCNNNAELFNQLCVFKTAPTAKVNIHILRKDDGTGNPLWDDVFVKSVVRFLTSITLGNVKFVLNTKTNIKNTDDYNSLSQDHLEKYANLREFTKITTIISNPNTTDAVGKAFNINYNYEPFFASRPSVSITTVDGKAKHEAEVMLHELGHNMGMKHNYDKTVHMDNYYYMEPKTLIDYVKGLNGCTTTQCHCQYSKYYISSCSDDDD